MTSTPPQQYCLRWNNYQNNLTNVFDQLLQSEAFVDVTLACEGHSLKAHKVVLSACSPYFQSLFFDNPCKHPIVILNGIKWDELKSVVEFMYRGEINVSQEQLAPLLQVAEVLKIRGLADVSRGGPGSTTLGASLNDPGEKGTGRNLAEFLANSNHEILDSGSDSPARPNGHTTGHHHAGMHAIPLGTNSNNPPALSPAQAHLMLASLSRRKRRKMSTPERTPSPPEDDMDEHSNQLEIDSTNGDYDQSPLMSAANSAGVSESPNNNLNAISMSLNNSSPGNNHGHHGSHGGSSSLGSIGPALLNLHAAAAAAAAVANAANQGSSNSISGSGNQAPNSGGGSSSVSNDLDIKPGIVEMIREEERAKMLESAHGWLGPSNSTLSDSYQYQIQNLWQKCWNQNQTGMMHALRFRERGPLKSWRPETMAEAIFAVLREGLSLSQAARKYDIPYPTFVLYANRVHNMLGPSADGCTSSDLMSDMRPKGRGRPQRILLGTWPEEHIRGVIRAVVFRDTQGKDDMPFVFNRDGGLCIPQTPGGSHNGIDMSLHQQFGQANPFLGASSSSSQGQANQNSSPLPSTSTGGNNSQQGVNLININESGNVAQHLQIQMSHGTSASSSTSSSPLQQALTANALSGIGAQAQSQLLALQQRHLQQQLQLHQRRSSSSDHNLSLSPPQGSGSRKNSFNHHHHQHHHHGSSSGGKESPLGKDRGGEKEILKIKTELLAPFDMEDEEEGVMDDEEERRVIQDQDDEVREEDEIGDHQNEVGLGGNRGRRGSYGGGGSSCGNNVKDLSQSGGADEQDLSCNNNKSPNTSTNNNNNNNNHTGSVSNSIDDGQRSQRDSLANDRVVQALLERGEVNTPSPKIVDHQTTTSS